MAKQANLFTTVAISYEDFRGYEREAQVEVDYTYDGETLTIVKEYYLDQPTGIGEGDFDELVYEAVEEEAPEAYAEWLADYGDWLYEQAQDRRIAA